VIMKIAIAKKVKIELSIEEVERACTHAATGEFHFNNEREKLPDCTSFVFEYQSDADGEQKLCGAVIEFESEAK